MGGPASIPDPDTVEVGPAGVGPALHCLPGLFSETAPLLALARRMEGVPVRILRPPGMDWAARGHATLEAMGHHLAERIVRSQPTGDLHLLGVCVGGVLAFSAARELAARGRRVASLVMIDTAAPAAPDRLRLDSSEPSGPELANHAFLQEGRGAARTLVAALGRYRPGAGSPVPIDLVLALRPTRAVDRDRRLEWEGISGGRLRLHPVAGGHMEAVSAHLDEIGSLVRDRLAGMGGSGLGVSELAARLGSYRLEARLARGEVLVDPAGRVLPVLAGCGSGCLDVVEVLPGRLRLAGWALDAAADRPAAQIVFFMDGTYAGRIEARHLRPDVVASRRGRGAERCGFSGEIELQPGDRLDRRPLRAFGLGTSDGRELFHPGGSVAARSEPMGARLGRKLARLFRAVRGEGG